MGEIHHTHHAEDQRQPDRNERVDPAEQDRRDDELGDQATCDGYLRWFQGPSGTHFARLLVSCSGHTLTSEPFCHCSM
jgi:hypothetical protein